MIVKDASTRDMKANHNQHKQDTCIVTENPGHSKRTKIPVEIEDYSNLKNEVADRRKLPISCILPEIIGKLSVNRWKENYRQHYLIQSTVIFL